ncbi:sorting nexin-4-like isoform X2 [Ptychodera flava]|uniref:sorting nexin-4-like isoform X2 n=1 Tax=Ptychodera flava TaxID=63121 RepID=UPI003969C931
MAADHDDTFVPDLLPERNGGQRRDLSQYFGRASLLNSVEICVSEPEKRSILSSVGIKDTYTVYLVETRIKETSSKGIVDAPTSLWRRYSEFELLRNYLVVTHPAIVVPPLPEKRGIIQWQEFKTTDNFDPDFIERRRVGLENFMLRIASHPQLSQDKIFHAFLQQEDNWKESVYETGFQAKSDSRLKNLNASFRLKKPDRQFEEVRNYGTDLQTNISNLLKIRNKLADRLYGIHKIHGNYGRVFSEWSGIEKKMGDGLQSAGHYMDVYASSIDGLLEEEEQYADQLKEYLFYADALRSVCRKQEVLQYELERQEENLSHKVKQKEELQTGQASGFSFKGVTKLFKTETPESKEAKLKQLEESITEAEEEVKKSQEEVTVFVDHALKDIERFRKQKVRDLREIFINYAILQIKMAKKGVAVWSNAKECFQKM